MKRVLWAALAVCALGGNAMASFLVSAAGPVASSGPIGDAQNGVINATYTGANDVFDRVVFDGDLTEVLTATFASEARWQITHQAFSTALTAQMSTTNNFTGTIHINRTVPLLMWANTGNSFAFQAYESANDGAGPDANWTNVVFNFDHSAVITDLGTLTEGLHTFDTLTSGFDTELALYSASGTLIASNDDIVPGTLQSSITQNLTIGDYMLVLAGYNAGFVNGFALPGTSTGTYNLNVDTMLEDTGSLAASTFRVYSFSVPEPATIGAIVIGALMARRRSA